MSSTKEAVTSPRKRLAVSAPATTEEEEVVGVDDVNVSSDTKRQVKQKQSEPSSTSVPEAAGAAGATKGKGKAGAKAKKAVQEKPPAGEIARSDTPRPARGEASLIAVHWNVAGLNGLLKAADRKALLRQLVDEETPHVLAISEHKISEEKQAAATSELKALLPEYEVHWAICTVKKGYSGVLALVKEGVSVESVRVDDVCNLKEGRTITLELAQLFLVAAYVPNSGQALERLDFRVDTWDVAMRAHLSKLQERKPVVLIGDLNVAHLDGDIWNVTAKHVPKSAGLTPRERESFGVMLSEVGLVDVFRALYPDVSGCFSYWSVRSGGRPLNRGLRLDYALVSHALAPGTDGPLAAYDCAMLLQYAPKGDHAPTLVALK